MKTMRSNIFFIQESTLPQLPEGDTQRGRPCITPNHNFHKFDEILHISNDNSRASVEPQLLGQCADYPITLQRVASNSLYTLSIISPFFFS